MKPGMTLDKYFGGDFKVIKLEDTCLDEEYDDFPVPKNSSSQNLLTIKSSHFQQIKECDEDEELENKKEDLMKEMTRKMMKNQISLKKNYYRSQSPPHNYFKNNKRNYSKDAFLESDYNYEERKKINEKFLKTLHQMQCQKYEKLEKIYNGSFYFGKKINSKIILAPIVMNNTNNNNGSNNNNGNSNGNKSVYNNNTTNMAKKTQNKGFLDNQKTVSGYGNGESKSFFNNCLFF